MSKSVGRFLTGLRGSSASGPHGKRSKDRANTEREVIDAELEGDLVPQIWLDAHGLTLEDLRRWGGYVVEESDADPS